MNNTLKPKWICPTFVGCVLTNNKALIITEVLCPLDSHVQKVYEEVLLVRREQNVLDQG